MFLELLGNFMLIFLITLIMWANQLFRKFFVKGHVYEISPKIICDFLKIPLYDFDDFEKDYDMDAIATKFLGIESKWPGKKTLKVSDLTLKYTGLPKITMTNGWPTSHYPLF